MRKTDIALTAGMVGQQVTLAGWVQARRNMGKIVFIDLRDRTGIVQVVLGQALTPGADDVKRLRPEFVVEVTGTVAERRGAEAKDQPLTQVEVQASRLEILNEAKTPPFEIATEERQAREELRLQYRYLDLRHQRMQRNLKLRHDVIRFIREYLSNLGFLEVETPYLTKGTPEGAREFIVPSRKFPGQFYTLPQSPQQFKQLLMVAGVERYFQIARCFRDEDTRGDRQPEFTQLDLEMSFVDVEDVLQLTEDLFTSLISVVTPDKHLTATPWPRIPYEQAMKEYGTDKPDLRKDKNDPHELAFAFIVDFPLFEHSATEQKLVPVHHLFTSPRDEDLPLLETDPAKAKAKQYDVVLNGFEVAGGSIRIHRPDIQKKIFIILKLTDQEVQRRFGHMLEALSYGAPPHGGIAPGLDRLVAVLANEPDIREVIAFPKTSDGRDVMMGAPSRLPAAQLDEVHVRITEA
ncbi:MAG: aspartate--tRNA ligase [Candidatus Kerfeldbacteria bacterium]|nr:aspartate--tRNA ligase [Candidatus Kerfeldbacteria bacterium]